MHSRLPAEIGASIAEIDTPALVIDLDAFDRNLAAMARTAERLGCRIRPHAKTHKSPVVALKQIAHGAVGVCCQKVSEAEALVAGGVGDVLVTNEIVGHRKLARLAQLATRARIGVCIDHPDAVDELEQAAAAAGARLEVLVEIDVGQRRCGIAAGEPAVRLAEAVARQPHLRFAGLQSYHGAAQHYRTPEERESTIRRAGAVTAETLRLLAAAGLKADTIGGAGTGTFEIEGSSGIWNELQPGSYIFMDADYARNSLGNGRSFDSFEHALFVVATVMSRPVAERAIVDAGHKALSNDSGFPTVLGDPLATYGRPSDEHGAIDLTAASTKLERGDRVWLIPGHCDPTVNLYDWYVGVRGFGTPDARVVEVWPITGRGAVT